MNRVLFDKLSKDDWKYTDEAREYFDAELLDYLDSESYHIEFEKIIDEKYGPFTTIRSTNIHTPRFKATGEDKIEYTTDFLILADKELGSSLTFKVNYSYVHFANDDVYESGEIEKSIGSYYIQKPKDSIDRYGGDYIRDDGMPERDENKETKKAAIEVVDVNSLLKAFVENGEFLEIEDRECRELIEHMKSINYPNPEGLREGSMRNDVTGNWNNVLRSHRVVDDKLKRELLDKYVK